MTEGDWERAGLMSDAIKAVTTLPNSDELSDKEKFEKARDLANLGRGAIDMILTKSSSGQDQQTIHPPGSKQGKPVKTVPDGLYAGRSYEQVMEDFEKRLTEAAQKDYPSALRWWHESGPLPIGPSREKAFTDTRYNLGQPSNK